MEDHAILLCSLLLGFSMDAYVCLGSSSDGPHAWVMTRLPPDGSSRRKWRITFWESLTGVRYDQKDPRVHYMYRRVGTVFNHRGLLGNIQENDMAFHTDFENLGDETKWKNMNEHPISQLRFPLRSVRVGFRSSRNALEPLEEEARLESALKSLIKEHREARGLRTEFDERMNQVLSSAIASYEMERITGKTFGEEEFQAAVKRIIPSQNTFSAFPIQFTHKDPLKIFETLKTAPVNTLILPKKMQAGLLLVVLCLLFFGF